MDPNSPLSAVDTPTDLHLTIGAARAIGIELKWIAIGVTGYFVSLRADGLAETPWIPLRNANQSQLLQARLRIRIMFTPGGSIAATAQPLGSDNFHLYVCEPMPERVEAQLRRAICYAAFLCAVMEEKDANPS